MMKPKAIKRIAANELAIIWQDGSEDRFPTDFLRAHCPCATCLHEQEENARQGLFSLPIANQTELRNIELSGHNAMIIAWGDGNKLGIYTWEYLIELRHKLGKT